MKELKEILDGLATELITRDAENTSFHDSYEPKDIMNAVAIFSCVLSNYSIKNGRTVSERDAKSFGESIAHIVFNMTGVDTKTYYK